MIEDSQLLARLDAIEARLNTLWARVFHKSALAEAIRGVVDKWPGPFTAQQIRGAIVEFHPQALPHKEHYQIDQCLRRMERAGQILRTQQGYGSKANIFERAANPPKNAGKPHQRPAGIRPDYESGFRNLVRSVLDDLPETFSLADVRAAVAARAPGVQIPYGSWSSQLYKLTQRGELAVVKQHQSVKHKLYSRGPVRIGPSGDELRELEKAWSDFRSQMALPNPQGSEFLSPAQRAEL